MLAEAQKRANMRASPSRPETGLESRSAPHQKHKKYFRGATRRAVSGTALTCVARAIPPPAPRLCRLQRVHPTASADLHLVNLRGRRLVTCAGRQGRRPGARRRAPDAMSVAAQARGGGDLGASSAAPSGARAFPSHKPTHPTLPLRQRDNGPPRRRAAPAAAPIRPPPPPPTQRHAMIVPQRDLQGCGPTTGANIGVAMEGQNYKARQRAELLPAAPAAAARRAAAVGLARLNRLLPRPRALGVGDDVRQVLFCEHEGGGGGDW
jgi:hypothetical protein